MLRKVLMVKPAQVTTLQLSTILKSLLPAEVTKLLLPANVLEQGENLGLKIAEGLSDPAQIISVNVNKVGKVVHNGQLHEQNLLHAQDDELSAQFLSTETIGGRSVSSTGHGKNMMQSGSRRQNIGGSGLGEHFRGDSRNYEERAKNSSPGVNKENLNTCNIVLGPQSANYSTKSIGKADVISIGNVSYAQQHRKPSAGTKIPAKQSTTRTGYPQQIPQQTVSNTITQMGYPDQLPDARKFSRTQIIRPLK